MSYFSRTIIAAAQRHALEQYPKESCGLVVAGAYVPCINYATDPMNDFIIAPAAYLRAEQNGGVEGVIHSHPNGPYYPNARDMGHQIGSGVPWAIIVTDGERAQEPVEWGDQVPRQPLIGREFMHGVTDCYSVLRDAFAAGREEMTRQGMPAWPFDPIVLPEVPRNDNWWADADDLYQDHFEKFGFRRINVVEAKPGDVFLMKIKSTKINHCGLLVAGDLILHHLANRLSRREPANQWARHAEMWIRHEAAR